MNEAMRGSKRGIVFDVLPSEVRERSFGFASNGHQQSLHRHQPHLDRAFGRPTDPIDRALRPVHVIELELAGSERLVPKDLLRLGQFCVV